MSAPPNTAPALFDARQLAEMIDTMGLLIASLSDRIDAQGRMLEQVHQIATEARAAAFAAEKATDWKRNGDLINEGIARGNRQIDELVVAMNTQLEVSTEVFELMRPVLDGMKRQERKLGCLRRWIPALLAGAVLMGGLVTLIGAHVVGR